MVSDAEPINLCHFPGELLYNIFTLIKYDASFDLDGFNCFEHLTKNTAEIKNLRLMCRKFAKFAAPLLLPVACCDIAEPESLKVLEHLSRHSVFSLHVKAVRVKLGFYDYILASDSESLAQYLAWVWSSFTKETCASDNQSYPLAKQDEIGRTLNEWFSLAKKSPYVNDLNCSDSGSNAGLRDLYFIQAEYRRRYLRQQDLRRSGDIIQRIGQAMARMPAATRLVLDDHPHHGQQQWLLAHSLASALCPGPEDDATRWLRLAQLATPMSWVDCWKVRTELTLPTFMSEKLPYLRPPIGLTVDLPVAVHRAGVRLSSLRVLGLQIPQTVPVWLTPEPYAPEWEDHPGPDSEMANAMKLEDEIRLAEPVELAEACQNLHVLEITPGYNNKYFDHVWSRLMSPLWYPHTDHDLTQLYQVVGSMYTGAKNLRQLHLDCRRLYHYDDNNYDYPSCDKMFKSLQNCSLPDLEVLHLENAKIKYGSLLLGMIRDMPNICELRLDGVTFYIYCHPPSMHLGRCWGSMLDGLREETPRLRENGARRLGSGRDLPIRVRDACHDWTDRKRDGTLTTLKTHVKQLFDDESDSGFTLVDEYLLGISNINPLVEYYERGLLEESDDDYSDIKVESENELEETYEE